MSIKTWIASYRVAAQIKDSKAAYYRGDYATALQLVRPLAVEGDAMAQYNLGVLYQRGRGVPQDTDAALKWYRLAAAQGEAAAQNNLGAMYESGDGVPQDYSEALNLYRLAAVQGYAEAQTNLGDMYADGHCVPQNYAEALKLYRLAAAQGVAAAQNNLGAMYERGHGVSQDYNEALKWYRKAAEGGNVTAHQNLMVFAASNGELSESECHAFEEALNRGEQFTLEDLDILRLLNNGNPNFRRPSNQKHDLLRKTPEDLYRDMMWEITGETQYRPISSSLEKLSFAGIAVVVWLGLPALGIFLVSRWLWS